MNPIRATVSGDSWRDGWPRRSLRRDKGDEIPAITEILTDTSGVVGMMMAITSRRSTRGTDTMDNVVPRLPVLLVGERGRATYFATRSRLNSTGPVRAFNPSLHSHAHRRATW